MQYLKGRNLNQVLADEGSEGLPLSRILALLTPVAEGIDRAFQRH